MTKEGPLYVKEDPAVFALYISRQCLKPVRNEVDEKRLSVKMNYRTGNIVGIAVKSVVTKRMTLLSCVVTKALSNYLLQ